MPPPAPPSGSSSTIANVSSNLSSKVGNNGSINGSTNGNINGITNGSINGSSNAGSNDSNGNINCGVSGNGGNGGNKKVSKKRTDRSKYNNPPSSNSLPLDLYTNPYYVSLLSQTPTNPLLDLPYSPAENCASQNSAPNQREGKGLGNVTTSDVQSVLNVYMGDPEEGEFTFLAFAVYCCY